MKFKDISDFFKLEGNTHYRHCERTAFLTYFALGVSVILILAYVSTGSMVIVLNQNLLYIFGGGSVVGLLGIVYYRFKYHKW